jgi:hypothetical protein
MDNEPQVVPANFGISVSAQPALGSVTASHNGAALIGASEESSLRVPAEKPQELAQPSQPTVDTSKLKALLITLGHDIEAEWDHLIALAKKAL